MKKLYWRNEKLDHNDILCCSSNDTAENTVVLSHAYDELPEGQYRIIKKKWTEY